MKPGVDRTKARSKFVLVKFVTADSELRIQLSNVKPGSKFAYEDVGGGVIVLKRVRANGRDPFKRGNLAKHLTASRDREQLAILEHC